MAAIAYAEPAIFLPATNVEPDMVPFPATGGANIKRGDFVTLAAGLLTRPAGAVGVGIPTSGIVGMTAMDQNAIYYTGIGGSAPLLTPFASNVALFGATTAGTPLQPGAEFSGTKVILGHNNMQFEVSLVQAYAISQIGSTAGIALDAASNLYVVDTSASNATVRIIGTIDGPNKGVVGDTGKRVLVAFLTTVLAL